MGRLVVVGISDQQIATEPDLLITYALGSCVGICLHDSRTRISGLAHILLPEAFGDQGGRNIYKFADTAIEKLVGTMERQGCTRVNLTAKIAGGANMFANLATSKSIGDRNVEVVKKELSRLRVRIMAEDTGANYGRTVEFNPGNGQMTVKSIGKGNKIF